MGFSVTELAAKIAQVGLSLVTSDSFVGPLTGEVTAAQFATDATGVGFFTEAGTPVAQQNVPLTAPDVQNVIDALVALGLVEQSD